MLSLSQMASVFLGRETMVRLDEVNAIHPSVESDADRDEALDWDSLLADSETGTATSKNKVSANRSKSASVRRKTRNNSSQVTASQAKENQTASANSVKKRGRPKVSQIKTSDKRGKGSPRRSGRIRSAPEPFAPVPSKGKSQRRQAAKANKKDGKEWEIECIVDSAIDKDTLEHFYFVKWKGYDSKSNTWEPKINMTNCSTAIMAYEKKVGVKAKE